MSDVSDEDLDALTARIRDHRRRQRNAKLVGVAAAFAGLVLAFVLLFVMQSMDMRHLGRRAFWLVAALGAFAGAALYGKLDPKEDISDLE